MPRKERKQKVVKKQLETAAKGSLSLKDWIQGIKGGDHDRGMCRLIHRAILDYYREFDGNVIKNG